MDEKGKQGRKETKRSENNKITTKKIYICDEYKDSRHG